MHPNRVFLLCLLFLCVLFGLSECGRRTGGGGRRTGGGSSGGNRGGGSSGIGWGSSGSGHRDTSHTTWGGGSNTHQNTGSYGWQVPSNTGGSSRPNHNTGSNPGWQVPSNTGASKPSQNTGSNVGWQVPSSNTGSNRPSQNTGSNPIGWNVPAKSNTQNTGSTGIGSNSGNTGGAGWTIPKPNTGSNSKPPLGTNIGWTSQNTGSKNTGGSGSTGWQAPSQNTGSNPKPPVNTNTGWNSHGTSSNTGDVGWKIPSHNTGSNAKPSSNSNTGWNTGNHGTNYKQESKPVGSSSNIQDTHNRGTVKPVGWDLPPRPSNAYQTSSGYHPNSNGYHPNSNGYHPNSNGYQPYQQYPQHGFQGQGPVTHITYKNKYNYNYPGHYSPPQPSYYPGYYQQPSSYSYGLGNVGSGALGFALGYGLSRLTTPTYSHYSFYDGYTPRYDHYEVHHYYHNRNSIPKTQEIQSNKIVGCIGDTATVCPKGTTSLCTSEGALMCVVSATSTVPCQDVRQVNCIRSEVPCYNSTVPECAGGKNSTVINIPCISNAQIYGQVQYVNNTIIVDAGNGTTNGTIGTTNSTMLLTSNNNATDANITTTLPPRVRRQINSNNSTSQNFCVTVVALPAKKQETAGEKVYDSAKDIVGKFFESAWGL